MPRSSISTMRLSRLYITLILVILASCEDTSKNDETLASDSKSKQKIDDDEDFEENQRQGRDIDTLKIIEDNPRNLGDKKLPILPPIILLDFANDIENSSSSSGIEKSKRTVDSSIGHGFGRNNFFTGKYNYYFPAGKSGTSVSIEESISPFLPKTIIETIKPITEKPYDKDNGNVYPQNPTQKNNYQFITDSRTNGQIVQNPSNHFLVTQQPIYGQRTKLYKPSQIEYDNYQTYGTTPRNIVQSYATSRPNYRLNYQSNDQNSYVTPKSNFPSSNSYSDEFSPIVQTTQRPYQSFTTQAPASYVTPTGSSYRYTANPRPTLRPTFDSSTTHRPASQHDSAESSLASFANLPRYTIENGVRYENKIVWKYPNGKISQSPPSSYVNVYNEFLTKQKSGSAPPVANYRNNGIDNYRNIESLNYQINGDTTSYQVETKDQKSQQNLNYQPSQFPHQAPVRENHYPIGNFGNIHSKSPAQFPNDQTNRPSRPSQFVSSASLASINHAITDQQQSFQPQSYENSYQGQYGQKTLIRGNPAASAASTSSSIYPELPSNDSKSPKDSYDSMDYEEQRPLSKYAVNSPNPEYTYTTESSIETTSPSSSTNLFTPSGKLSTKVLSKYSSEAQKYLIKVFANDKKTLSTTNDENYNVATSNSYASTNYENLLNYNPSIGQYIRDPSTILNAQPTFIQAGNSLIPVIILRVDGVSPIRPKVTPNINLKALLQQYLTRYAGTISQNTNGKASNYIRDFNVPATASQSQNPLYELAQLARSLSQYSDNPSLANDFAKQIDDKLNKNQYSHERSNYYPSSTSYGIVDNDTKNMEANNYGRTGNKQKIKSVQIIEDPRYTSYKVNS